MTKTSLHWALILWISLCGGVLPATANGHTELDTPILTDRLDQAFFLPQNQQKFDSTEWKRSPTHRFAMLVELYRMKLVGKTEKEIDQWLGPAERTTKDDSRNFDKDEIFDLGSTKDSQLGLDVTFHNGHVTDLSIKQYCQPGVESVIASNWQTTNRQTNKIAEYLNQYYFLVGAPVESLGALNELPAMREYSWLNAWPFPALTTMTGCRRPPVNPSCGQCLNQFEIEYAVQNNKIERFRLIRLSAVRLGLSSFSEWQSRNLRPDSRCFTTANAYQNVSGLETLFITPKMEFEPSAWKKWCGSRKEMLCDLVCSRRLVGMNRARVYELLGKPERTQSLSAARDEKMLQQEKSDQRVEMTDDCDWYAVSYFFCGNAPTTYFELAYQGGFVKGYRVTTRDPFFGMP